MLSTLKLPWYVIFPALFLSGFYSAIDFNGLQLRSLVSESLVLYLYGAQTARYWFHFFPLRILKGLNFIFFLILVYYFNWDKFRSI